MTRKDYILLAATLNAVRESYNSRSEREVVDAVAGAMALVLGKDNPRFDKERFIKAVVEGT